MVNGWRRRWLLLGFGLRESMSVCTRAPRHRWRPSLFRLLILECVLRDRRRPEEDGEVFVSNLSVPLAAQFTHVCGARDNCLLAFCVWGPFAGELSGIHPLQSLWGRRQAHFRAFRVRAVLSDRDVRTWKPRKAHVKQFSTTRHATHLPGLVSNPLAQTTHIHTALNYCHTV